MDFTPIDGYLLEGRPSKADAIEHLLRERIADPRAAPFYRALEAVGARAADEALLAMRALAAGKAPEDALIRRLRALVALTRAAERSDRAGITSALRKSGGTVDDLRALAGDPPSLARAARAAYAAELS